MVMCTSSVTPSHCLCMKYSAVTSFAWCASADGAADTNSVDSIAVESHSPKEESE